jgi:hypothetical protein
MMNWKGSGRNFPGGTEENHENLDHDSRSSDRDLNMEHPEYEAGVLKSLDNHVRLVYYKTASK